MGGEAPETCWATHKRQVINLWKCCILLVDLFKLSINVGRLPSLYVAGPVFSVHPTWPTCISTLILNVLTIYYKRQYGREHYHLKLCFYYTLHTFCLWHNSPIWAKAASLLRFLNRPQLDTHSWCDSSERVISLSQRPLPTQHTKETNFRALSGIRTRSLKNRAAADLRLKLVLRKWLKSAKLLIKFAIHSRMVVEERLF
jgi:hypothetical protein